MKLFHFTWIAHLPAMLGMTFADGTVAEGERGITPSVGDFQTAGQPVVWLTSRESLKPTRTLAGPQSTKARNLRSDHEDEGLPHVLSADITRPIGVGASPAWDSAGRCAHRRAT
jgi:hypothetical protein